MKVGLFGGAFNPPHNGHIVIATLSIEILKLDVLYVIPTFIPPHRNPKELAPYEKRLEWLKEAFEGMDKICVSTYERDKGGISYSVETVSYFSEMHGTKPYFIIGEDSALYFEKWYRWEELKKMACFVVYPRYRGSRMEEIKRKHPEFMFLESLPLIEISATGIRERIKMGKPIRGMVPQVLEEDIVHTYKRLMER